MKNIILLSLIFPGILYSQVQVGSNIDGEAPEDRFGWSVSLSSDGNIVAGGAPGNDANNLINSGHVRAYENINGAWVQIGNDIDGADEYDVSGWSVKLSANGNIVAIGATDFGGAGPAAGRVRVYENQSGTWTQIGGDIEGENSQDQSGRSISLSDDGSVLAIGAPYNNGNGLDSGHVRVYKNQSGTWVQIGDDIDGEFAEDRSGYNGICISGDGTIVAIGAHYNDGNGTNSGHVRVYENQSGIWTQIGDDIDGEAPGDWSGYSVSLSADGDFVAIGAPYNNGNSGSSSGHVRVYENQSGVWNQIGNDIDGEAEGDLSGIAVSLSDDGTLVAIGAALNDGSAGLYSGHVRLYQNQSGIWTQLGVDIDGESGGDRFGQSVSLSGDGNFVTAGAPNNNVNGFQSGSVRVYDISNPLSIENKAVIGFSLYPNPSTNTVNIQLEVDSKLEAINVYNNLGQLISTFNESIIDISQLSAGLYLIEIETSIGKGLQKLIKN